MTAGPENPPAPILSPCINVCVIDPQSRLCTGCLRSIDEITSWMGFSDAERAAVMSALPNRKQSRRP